MQDTDTTSQSAVSSASQEPAPKPEKHHRWLRRVLYAVGGLLLIVILLPVMLYIPPVQDFAVKTATRIVAEKTGMKIGIDKLRLKFPLDLSLQGVSVIEASGDTMVMAKEVLADVKMRPLINLDVQINRLRLIDGYYRMLSPDSSMLMKIRAGLLEVDSKSSADLRTNTINLNEATLKNGDVTLSMDVWKQTPTPQDTTSVPFYITAGRLNIEGLKFTMMMLPTIDTLNFYAKKLTLDRGVIDLRTNNISIGDVAASDGDALMLAPSMEYVKEHPAPVADTISSSAPTTVKADRISLSNFNARYAVKDAPEVEGFDASDIRVSSLNLSLENFFNRATDLTLPITSMSGMEQCGLTITEGSGVFSMDSTGMMLKDFRVLTPYSSIAATAALPNALLEMQPTALLDVDIDAQLGLNDINSFMPSVGAFTSALPKGTSLNARVIADGELGDADISRFDAALPGVISLRAKGKARNALDLKNLVANLTFDGELTDPKVITNIVPMQGVKIPSFTISGHASAERENYAADFKLLTPKGQVAANGKVGLNSERYDASVEVRNLNVGYFIENPAIGPVSANLTASGAGFNPEKKSTHTDVKLDLASAVYNKHELKDIRMLVSLNDGDFTFRANSPSPLLDFDISGNGNIDENDYRADITANLRMVDLQGLGMSETPNAGSASLRLSGTASPHTWIYDVDLDIAKIDWVMDTEHIVVPDSVMLKLNSGESDTRVLLQARGTNAEFHARSGLQGLIDRFSSLGALLPQMIESKRLDVPVLEQNLPEFTLTADASGSGIASEFLGPSGMSFNDFSMRLGKDSIISGDMRLLQLNTGSMSLDTITLGLNSRRNLLDYKIHLGNRPGTFDEFAQVNMSGYAGENRLSAFLNQRNIKGKTGYRLGFTASLADSIMSVRFTPLKATIAYLPWTFNMDNYVDVNMNDYHLNANLLASSDNSSILLKTEPGTDGKESLHMNLKNIRVEDFLQMALNAPPVKANINSDMRVRYTGKALVGKGNLDISDLYYDRQRVGDFNITLQAGMGKSGKSAGKVGLLVDDKEAAAVQFVLAPDSLDKNKGLIAERLKLVLTEFPLSIANPFFPPRTMKLSGALNGDMSLSGSFTNPQLNGSIACHDVALFFNMLGTNFKFGGDPITVVDNVLDFHEFNVRAVNDNPLTLKGTVDARKLSDIRFDLSADARNMQLVGGKNSNSDMTGKLFVDLDASVKGPISMMDINAYVNVLPTTDVTYNMEMASDALNAQKRAEGMVEFVNFNDSVKVVDADTLASSLAMRIVAQAVISQGSQVTVNLGDDGKVECNPSGTLNYFQNFLGDMKLNGTLYTGSGLVNYTIPYVQKKFTFDFDRNSHITWSGDIMNPALDVDASNTVKANIQMGGNTRLVNFLVSLAITNTLSAPSVVFNLSTDDDVSISNELQAMTADQRQQQAISLLLTGRYSGPSAKTVGGNFLNNSLYNVLTSTLNTLAANAIKGVDINFGVDQYQTGNNGNTSTATSYSYQVSKSLINNRFKILVGGNYTTGSADENFQQNLISDIAFEYILKQTNNMSLNARLYRHTGFESVLEGEITETGVGLSLRRRLAYFTEITHFGLSKLWKKKKPVVPDTVKADREEISLPADSLGSIMRNDDENEK